MWYVKLNGRVIPTPYMYYKDAFDEAVRLKHATFGGCTSIVHEKDL